MEDVERAYKELSNAWRPENFQNLPRYKRKAELKLKEINEAYERLQSYLAARPHLEVHNNRSAPATKPVENKADPEPLETEPESQPVADPIPDTEAELPVDESMGPPPWERPVQPIEDNSRPPIQKTAQKSLIFGFVAILAVLGVLQLYRVFDRQKPAETTPPATLAEKSQPVPASPTRTPARKQETKPAAGIQKQPTAAVAPDPEKIDYRAKLTRETLSPYNRDPARIRRVQKSLIAKGIDTGPIDGIIGPYTSRALQQFARDHQMSSRNLFAPDLPGAVVLYAEVAAMHPDWHQIISSNDFVRWLESQTYYPADQMQTLKESASAQQVGDIFMLYKLERNMQSN
jgi:hypothetical protein